MDFNKAIAAHLRWRTMLSRSLAEPVPSLSPSLVGSTEHCELGQWLNGEGRQYCGVPEFTALVASHAQFHQAAAAVVRKARSGQSVTQDLGLGLQSGYGTASSEIIKALLCMKRKASGTHQSSPSADPVAS